MGFGYAAEACAAALDWFDGVLPGVPTVLATQTADVGSMRLAAKLGFTEVERFRSWDAEQWLGLRSPVTPSDGTIFRPLWCGCGAPPAHRPGQPPGL